MTTPAPYKQYQKREAKPEPYQHKPTPKTTTTPAPHKKYKKREALPEPNPYKPTTTATATPVPYKKHQNREAKPEPYQHKPTPTTTTTPAPHKKYKKREALPEPNPYKPTTTNLQPQLQLHQQPTKDRRENPPPTSKQTSGSSCYLPSSLKCECYQMCCRGRNNPNDCPATVSFQCNIPIVAFPRWEVSRVVFRVGRYFAIDIF